MIGVEWVPFQQSFQMQGFLVPAMHNGATAVLIIGGIILIGGITLLVIAGPSADTVYIDPSGKAEWRGSSAAGEQLSLDIDNDYQLYIKKGGELNDISITDSQGEEVFLPANCNQVHLEADRCDGEWVEIGEFGTNSCPCTLMLNATEDVLIVEYGEAGFKTNVDEYFGQMAFGCLGLLCGIVVLAVGGGWALLQKNQATQLQLG